MLSPEFAASTDWAATAALAVVINWHAAIPAVIAIATLIGARLISPR